MVSTAVGTVHSLRTLAEFICLAVDKWVCVDEAFLQVGWVVCCVAFCSQMFTSRTCQKMGSDAVSRRNKSRIPADSSVVEAEHALLWSYFFRRTVCTERSQVGHLGAE